MQLYLYASRKKITPVGPVEADHAATRLIAGWINRQMFDRLVNLK